jgi:hypothetical protein
MRRLCKRTGKHIEVYKESINSFLKGSGFGLREGREYLNLILYREESKTLIRCKYTYKISTKYFTNILLAITSFKQCFCNERIIFHTV